MKRMKKLLALTISTLCSCFVFFVISSVTMPSVVRAQCGDDLDRLPSECDEVGENCCYENDTGLWCCEASLMCESDGLSNVCVDFIAPFNCGDYCVNTRGCGSGACTDSPPCYDERWCTCNDCPHPPPPPIPPGPSADNFASWIKTAAPNFSIDTTPGEIISTLIPYIYGIAGFAMLLYLVIGGYQIMVSQGDPKQMAAGREKITNAMIGFIIMFAAYWITRLAGEILDIQQIKDIFGG